MLEKILEITRTATFRNTSVATSAMVINGLLGFIFFWLMARIFNPTLLGTFAISLTAAGLITDVANIGTGTGIINFVGKYINTNREKALKFLKLALGTNVFIASIILIVGWIISPIVASSVLGKPELTEPLHYSLLIAGSILLFNFSSTSLQALQKFYKWGILIISANAARLTLIYFLFVVGVLTLDLSLLVYITMPLFAFFISLFYLPKFLKVKHSTTVFSEFFNYNKWVAVFTIISAIGSRLDIFLLARISTLEQVGIYSVAGTLVSIIPQITGAIGTVVAPRLAGIKNDKDAIRFLKKLQLFVGGLAIAGIFAGTIIGYFVIKNFYAVSYSASYFPFLILLFAQAIFLFSIPVHMVIIYYFSYPRLFVSVSIGNLLIVSIGGLFLIGRFGFIGAAMAVLLGNTYNFIVPAIWVVRKFKK